MRPLPHPIPTSSPVVSVERHRFWMKVLKEAGKGLAMTGPCKLTVTTNIKRAEGFPSAPCLLRMLLVT